MKKPNTFKIYFQRLVLLSAIASILSINPFQAKADFLFGGGGAAAGGYSPAGYYNPSAGFPGMPGINPLWGGGYNLNSLSGGGWGGFPAGYGFGPAYPYAGTPMSAPGPAGGGNNGGPAMTGGFGGYYSPFVGGF